MKRKKEGYFALMRTVFSVAVKKLPLLFLLLLASEAAAGVLAGSGVWFKQQMFEQAEAAADGAGFSKIAAAIIVLGIYLVLQHLMNGLNFVVINNFELKLVQEAGEELNRKAARVDPICYEDNRFLDHMEKAGRGTEAAVSVFDMSLSMLLTIISYFGFMGGYLNTIEPMLLVVMLSTFIPYIFGAVVRYRVNKSKENLSAPYRRRGEYYGQCITEREYVKETRMLGGYGYFFQKMKENLEMVKNLDWKAVKKTNLINIGLRFLTLLGYVATVLLLFYYLMNGRVGVSAFAAVLSSLDGMAEKLESLFRLRIGYITRNLGMAENYLEFLKLPERRGNTSFPEGKTVEFQNVSFAYPNASENSLKNITLSIHEKETIAIVGCNGAGKSTFARLLLGIYRPSEGAVLIDGVDTRELLPGNSVGRTSAVFQKFQKYKMTALDNVVLSNTCQEQDLKQVSQALEKADLEMDSRSFPEGTATLLAREFGGTDLSGGQWQRLAIARGFYRKHNLIVLDEPTSAIDPLEETRIYEKFAEMSRDKTAVIITHRLGSAKIADRIVVLDEGRIVETGTHRELMERKKHYYEMYQAQAKWYA